MSTSTSQRPPLDVRVRRVPGPPVVSLRAWVRGGARIEETPGLALLTGRALTGGNRISWSAEAAGAELVGSASLETHGLRIDALARHAERALDWTAELLLDPAFSEDRCRRLAHRQTAELEALDDRPDLRTARAFLHRLYAPHPAARPLPGDEESLSRLARKDVGEACGRFHRRGLTHGVVLTVAGAIDADRIEKRAHELFGPALADLAAAAPSEPPAPPPSRDERRTVALPPGGQAHLFLGRVTVPRTHPDRTALELLAVVLGWGGGLAGRLPERLRHREALAYSVEVRTLAEAGLDPGRFVVYAATAPEHLERAEQALREELDRVAGGDLGAAEIEEARAYLLGRLPFHFEIPGQWAEAMGDAALYRRPEDDPRWHAERLRSVTVEEIHEMARRHLKTQGVSVTLGIPGEAPGGRPSLDSPLNKN